ncbi:hypothetical protein [Zavarzinella formosa]|uniref:hypothetical protein n=1 Tax=Zavarzinella formosa TaxID=360055 RepID=UPI0003810D90|nr:hypothetical protein [Zavarzinella formosa]
MVGEPANPSQEAGASRRVWLVVPTWLFFAIDVILTLIGQPEEYWAGDYSTANEINPLAFLILTRSPWLFAGLSVVWGAILGVVVLWWRHPWTGWLAAGVAFAHVLGGGTWIIRAGPWGWGLAVIYLALASRFSRWCWRRSGWAGG